MIKDTSIKCYEEIQEEGIYDNRMEEVLDAIRNNPLMTGREYASLILGYTDMNIVRPRISDLFNLGYIIEVGKRKCSCSGRTSYVWATLEDTEKLILKKIGFKEEKPNLYYFKEDDICCFQDFRKGKRRCYSFDESGISIASNTLDIYKKFKEELNKLITNETK